MSSEDIINELREILIRLEVDDAEISISNLGGDELTLNIDTEKQAVLIGRHGENLRSLQYLLNSIIKHRDPKNEFISLDVANYKKERQEKLIHIAQEAANKARDSKAEVRLKPMSAFERRQVHMVLADETDIVTDSVGDEPRRSVVVRPRD